MLRDVGYMSLVSLDVQWACGSNLSRRIFFSVSFTIFVSPYGDIFVPPACSCFLVMPLESLFVTCSASEVAQADVDCI